MMRSMQPRITTTNRFAALLRTSETRNGLPLLWIALAVCVYDVSASSLNDPLAALSTDGWFSSAGVQALLHHPWTWNLIRGIVLVAACLWSVSIGVPVTGWLTALGYLCVSACSGHNPTSPDTTCGFVFWILAIHAVWYQVYRRQMLYAVPWHTWLDQRNYPGWVPFLCVYSIAVQATLSGLQQVFMLGGPMSGGLSLQIALRASANVDSQLVQHLLGDRSAAAFVYVCLLTIQCLAFLGICFRPLRTAIGIGLITVQVFDFLIFGAPALGNALLIAAVLLPWQDIAPVLLPKLKQSALSVFGFGPAANRNV